MAAVIFAVAMLGDGRSEVLRFGVTVPARTVTVRAAMQPWADEVSALSDGALEIELYPGGALGRSGKLQYWMLKQGIVDITWMLPSNTPNLFPSTDFFEIPLKTSDPMEMSLAFWRLYERGYLKGFDDIKPLALYVSPPYRFHLRFAYEDNASLKGKKIRAITYLQARMLEEAGATPVGGVTTNQLAESLSRGLIDGALFSWHGVKPVGIMRTTDVHVDQAITFMPAIIAMNRDVYEALSPKARAAIDELSGEPLIARMVNAMNGAAAAAIDEARRDPERQFVEADAAEAAIWRERFAAAAEDWRTRSPDHDVLIERFDEILAEIRAEAAMSVGSR
jgi:TRAP-type C4-dicarboxylate transport system substrate-binding protein